ncbi:putative secreted protein (Por secretion system target), partial [Lacibacter cauensis]
AGGGSFGVFGAGLLISGTPSQTLTRCVFANNSGGSGFFDGSRGGGLYIDAGAHTISNCIFYGNSSDNGAAMMAGGAEFNTSSFVNCTFANNTSRFAGTAYSGFTDAVFRNCILWNNTPTSTSVPGRNEIYSSETRSQYWPTFNNCIIRDATGSPLSVTNTVTSSVLNGNPLFVNYSDGDGADNIWGTADDGLRLQCSSPAVGAGTGSTPTTDFLGLTRTATLDIGAYEGNHSNSAFNAIPAAFSSVTISQNSSGISNYSNCTSQVAAIQSGGSYTLTGQTTATVWIESVQPSSAGLIFVKRHYEVTALNNPASATARVTLFFTQQEFDEFNAVSDIDLPAGPSDLSGKANLLIEKREGKSSNGTGLPGTYAGSVTTINPVDTDILWNSTANRWEVSFDVNGFSGFFVKTSSSALPLQLISFTAVNQPDCIGLSWKTENEQQVREFVIEKLLADFKTIGVVPAKNGHANYYTYSDYHMNGGTAYYRLKMIDHDGGFTYSNVVSVNAGSGLLKIIPNPVKDHATLFIGNSRLLQTTAFLFSANGTKITEVKIEGFHVRLNIGHLNKGVYYLKFEDGSILRLLKE